MEPKNKSGFNRRDFLKVGALSGLFLGTSAVAGCSNDSSQKNKPFEGRAKYIIFLVSDGMSMGTLQMADLMRRRMEGRPSAWIRLYEEGKVTRSLMDMASANSSVTGSGAASSSWGSGVRVHNTRINYTENDEMLTPVVPLFKAAGKKTGLVTSTRLTHATPAGFAASVPQRGMEDEIAQQYYERQPDILLGGGSRHFDGSKREDGRDLFSSFADEGYKVLRTKSDMKNLGNGFQRMLGLFTESHLPYSLDHKNTPELAENVPTLAEMTKEAIDRLYASGDGFILQVEGGRVDHAAHGMDAAGLVYDQIAFDDAVETAYSFYEQHPDDTLLVITTDHGNANPAINATGSRYNDSDPNFDKLQTFRHTNDWIQSAFRDGTPTVNQVIERIEYATGIAISNEQAEMYRLAHRRERKAAYNMRSSAWATLGEIMSNYTSVAFTGTAHTADYVELAMAGPGSDSLGMFVRNTELFTLMTTAAGVPVEAEAEKA